MGIQSRSKRRNIAETGLPLRGKDLLTVLTPLSGKKRLGDEIEVQRPSKKFHLVETAEFKHFANNYVKSYTGPPAAESAKIAKEEHVCLDDIMYEATLIDHSSELDEQEEHDDDDFAFNFAMGLLIFGARATDVAKLLGAYDPLDDKYDDEETEETELEGEDERNADLQNT